MVKAIKLFLTLFFITILSGCFYQADKKLHANLKTYSPKDFFGPKKSYFFSVNNGDKSTNKDAVIINHLSSGTYYISLITGKRNDQGALSPSHRKISEVFRIPSMKEYMYYAAIPRTEGKYYYLLFKWHNPHSFTTYYPEHGADKVNSVADLLKYANANYPYERQQTYKRANISQKASIIASLGSTPSSPQVKNYSSKPIPKTPGNITSNNQYNAGGIGPTGIDALDIGDGVYVKGFFSDELSYVVRIDKSTNTVKVRSSQNGTTKWVYASQIMTKKQSQQQDLKRIEGLLRIVSCAENPKQSFCYNK